jgi:hypothetical protein
MRKIILVILFVVFNLMAYTQVIKGTIFDEKTKSTIPYASVYFNGTFVGTTTDQQGRFVLDIPKQNNMPLTISAIGYFSTTITKFRTNESLTINLKPKEYELKETSVKSKSLVRKRKRYLTKFRNEFLGTTNNALKCTILNEKDITFNYNTTGDTLKAYALKPIIIENRALGYTITYYLDNFEYFWDRRTVFFVGNIKFSEIATSGITQEVYADIRKKTYIGSKMHFFRSLWNNELKAQGFSMETPVREDLNMKDVVAVDSMNNKYLHYPERFIIWNKNAGTSIQFLKNYVYFDNTGYFDPSGLNWLGGMGDGRIADWLPYEYAVGK